MKPSAADILLGRYKTPEELKLEREIDELPEGAEAQQADLDRAVVLLQTFTDNRQPPPQELVEKLAVYLNRDGGYDPRKPVALAPNVGAEMEVREFARFAEINPNSVEGYIKATGLEAKCRVSDAQNEPSINALARAAGVSRSSVRRWRGDDPKEDEAKRRGRWAVWRFFVDVKMKDLQKNFKNI
ncbi:MAG: hypothetical protein HON62_10285 [Rhodospirillaceae bacterium]|jgi:hypothetical protein|nr:hypothetical protein [Rhodospirillaceae bacterium]